MRPALPHPPLWLAVLTLLRLVVAAVVPLAPDEAYYRIWAHAPAWGYLDHPPMVAWWMRAGMALAGDGPLGLRLFGPFAALLGSLLLMDAVERRAPGKGEVAALLLNATLLFGAGAVLMTPDTPLLLFWTAALWAIARLEAGWDRRWWLVAGAAAGLALLSKYTAFLLFPAALLWLLAARPGELRRWQLWAGLALALAIMAPNLAWNAAHGWASFAKQGGRVFDIAPRRAAQFLAELVAGQIGLATPLVAWLLARGQVFAWRQHAWLPLAFVLVPVFVFVAHGLGDRVQGNWPAILYPGAAMGAALMPLSRRHLAQAVGLGMGITLLVYVQAATGLLPIPPRLDPAARQLRGWAALARALPKADFVAADNYGTAAELALWRGHVLGTEPRWSFLALPRVLPPGQGLLLAERPPDPALWREAWPLGEAVRTDRGVVLGRWHLWRVTARQNLALLPR